MAKLVPLLVHNFDLGLEHPDREWTCKNYWFTYPKDFYIRIRNREL